MFCNRCGSSNPDEVRFCIKCGAPVAELRNPQSSTPTPEYNLPSFSQGRTPPNYAPQSYQNYQAGPAGGVPQGTSASGRAITSMVLSLVSIVSCGPFLSVPGLILGKLELDAIRAGKAPKAGEGFAKVGFYTGIAITALSCLAGIAYLCVLFFTLSSGGRW